MIDERNLRMIPPCDSHGVVGVKLEFCGLPSIVFRDTDNRKHYEKSGMPRVFFFLLKLSSGPRPGLAMYSRWH